ncbi:MAG: recombinase family protein [Bacteroidota bacterium]
MTDLELFRSKFGIGADKDSDAGENKRTVLWTRVSTKGQEDNTSLVNQRETCYKLVEREGLEVVAEFGGKGESARVGSIRKEFHRMLDFVKKKTNRIRFIVFYDHSRFSREGGKAIYVKDELRDKYGIVTKSAVLPLDTEDPYADAMDSTQYLMARAENEKRRRRTMDGVKARLLQGYWANAAPVGYKWDRNIKMIVPDEVKAPLIRKAFQWKYKDPNLSTPEISARLRKLGLRMSTRHLRRIFHNPVYCGYIAHKMLAGDVVKGKHEPIISKDVFLAIHNLIRKKSGWPRTVNLKNKRLPLKVFLKCQCCGGAMTGYENKNRNGKPRKNPIPYYKCRNGCKGVTRNANVLNDIFLSQLKKYRIKAEFAGLIGKELRASLIALSIEKFEEAERLEQRLLEIEGKLKRLRQRFVLDEEITRAEHDEFAGMLFEQKAEILKALEQSRELSSNHLDHIEEFIRLSSNLALIWENGDLDIKQKVQNMAFPEGMYYNKKNDTVLTPRVNEVIRYSCEFTQIMMGYKDGLPGIEMPGGLYPGVPSSVNSGPLSRPFHPYPIAIAASH